MIFPLFDQLKRDCEAKNSKELSSAQKKTLEKKFESMDQEGFNIIFALIYAYAIQNDNLTDKNFIPYEGTLSDNNYKFDLDKLPKMLKIIVHKFILMHYKKMEDDKKRDISTSGFVEQSFPHDLRESSSTRSPLQ